MWLFAKQATTTYCLYLRFPQKNSVKRSKKTVITSFTGTICLENQENSFIEDIFRNFAHGKGMVCNLTA